MLPIDKYLEAVSKTSPFSCVIIQPSFFFFSFLPFLFFVIGFLHPQVFSLIFRLILYIAMFCLHTCMYVHCVLAMCLRRWEEGVRAGVTGSSEPPCGGFHLIISSHDLLHWQAYWSGEKCWAEVLSMSILCLVDFKGKLLVVRYDVV